MRHSDRLFFAVLRRGLWGESKEGIEYPADKAVWDDVLALSASQTVMGIMADGLSDCSQNEVPPKVAYRFISASISTEHRNGQINSVIASLFLRFESAGVPVVLVKGQAIAQCYRHPSSRMPGDIDLIVKPEDFEAAKAVVRDLSGNTGECNTEQMHFATNIGDVEIEVHGTVHTTLSRKINSMLNEMQMELFSEGGCRTWNCDGVTVRIPSEDFDSLYIFIHLLQHFFCGGLGLRQLCDMSMALYANNGLFSDAKLARRIRRAGLESEWKTFVAFLVNYLGLPEHAAPLYDAKYLSKADRIWDYIRRAGNFGKNNPRRYGMHSAYLLRKTESLLRNASGFARHIRLFPADSFRFFGYYLTKAFKSLRRGE